MHYFSCSVTFKKPATPSNRNQKLSPSVEMQLPHLTKATKCVFSSFDIKLFIIVCNVFGIIIIGHLRIFAGSRIGIFKDDIRIIRVILLAALPQALSSMCLAEFAAT